MILKSYIEFPLSSIRYKKGSHNKVTAGLRIRENSKNCLKDMAFGWILFQEVYGQANVCCLNTLFGNLFKTRKNRIGGNILIYEISLDVWN